MLADTTLAAQEPFVLTTHANGVATLTLNRPERFNPLSSQMIAAIQAELNAIAGGAIGAEISVRTPATVSFARGGMLVTWQQ